jgi:hypothetical protein
LPGVIDKGFLSVRAGTKAKAIEVVILYVEIENEGSGVIVSSRLGPVRSLSHRHDR